MIKKALVILGVIAVILVVVIATRPSTYRVTRTATIDAPPQKVFPHVNHLTRWEAWSPWATLDPNMNQAYEGPEAGVGARYTWTGNNDVGEGRMTITESRSNELVRLQLEFFEPMEGQATTEFTFEPSGEQTTVTWSMSGTNNFIGKAMSLVMDMDRMIGSQFELGLASLGDTVKKHESASQPSSGLGPENQDSVQ